MKSSYFHRLHLLHILIYAIFLSFVFSCQKEMEEPQPEEERGDLVLSTFISGYTSQFIRALIDNYNVEVDVELKYDIDVYRILYYTSVSDDGSLLIASGVLIVPKASDDLPAICINHGTETKRDLVASENLISVGEGVAGMVTASMGFVTFIPDYLGLGSSDILHPYLHAVISGGTVIDMIRAGDAFCKQENIALNKDLYIGGYSEGGFVTLAAQKEIESQTSFPFELVASAPQAGPYDLYSTVDYFIDKDDYPEPVFMAYLMTAYNYVYGWDRLQEIYKSPYAWMMSHLFDGTKTTSQINSQLPAKVSDLFSDKFIQGFKNGTDQEVINALYENTILSWTPVTPMCFYHCISDEVVPYQNTVTAIEKFRSNGASKIELVTYYGMTHSETSLKAIPDMIEWFDSLRVTRY